MKIVMRQERIKRGWTQEYVAKRCNVSLQVVCDWENNRRKPSYKVLIKLLDLFDVSDPRRLFALVDESKDECQNQILSKNSIFS